ncbi:hypothetical protein DQ04_06281000 [Trypanosoma grayi]|uniref:hypothetical protein n=1 Tax=Trypanosoma grayi TaxID=71804 RepID=UPI0004F4184D|nr:hypothetical protein DQ04_06281000 [Trypanosoma grayi]KEG08865.1 hypothetical protein DQ04_06281000 [Trypanosoma grayi]
MFGEMYDAEASKRPEAPECDHPVCVRNQMFILMAVNVLATLAGVLVHLRFARFTALKCGERDATCVGR